jgi:hypothetical protein
LSIVCDTRDTFYADRCAGCGFPIEDAAIKALGRLWHRECFACSDCHAPLFDDGDEDVEFLMLGDRPYCEEHFVEQVRCTAMGGMLCTA